MHCLTITAHQESGHLSDWLQWSPTTRHPSSSSCQASNTKRKRSNSTQLVLCKKGNRKEVTARSRLQSLRMLNLSMQLTFLAWANLYFLFHNPIYMKCTEMLELEAYCFSATQQSIIYKKPIINGITHGEPQEMFPLKSGRRHWCWLHILAY